MGKKKVDDVRKDVIRTYMGLVRIGKTHFGPNAIINIGTPFEYKEGRTDVECPVCGMLLEFETEKDVTVTRVVCKNCQTVEKRIDVRHAFFTILTSTGPRIYEVENMVTAIAETRRILEETNRAITTKYVFTSEVEREYNPNSEE